MKTRLLLIRHGETGDNVRCCYAGRSDVDLNARGIRQAVILQRKMRGLKIERVYSSDRRRARHFAELVFPGARVCVRPALGEMNFGVLEGLTHRQCLARHGRVYKNWLAKSFRPVLPGGEGLDGFRKRVLRALGRIVFVDRDQPVAVVTHGGVIRAALDAISNTRGLQGKIPALGSARTIEWRGSWAKSRLS